MIFACDLKGSLVLHLVVNSRHLEIINLLINKDTKLNIVD